MRYYSDKLDTLFDSEKELKKAETEHDKKIAEEKARKEKLSTERANRAKEVEDAAKAAAEANKVYHEKLNAFISDYDSFHMTLSGQDSDLFDIFNMLF